MREDGVAMRLELTRRADYAVRAVLELAAQDERLSVPELAVRQSIPVRFLPQVMQALVGAGLVVAQMGRRGGYLLARDPASITLLEVIEAVEGDARRKTCVLRGVPCGADGQCAVHPVFAAAQEKLLEALDAATLASIVAADRPGIAPDGTGHSAHHTGRATP